MNVHPRNVSVDDMEKKQCGTHQMEKTATCKWRYTSQRSVLTSRLLTSIINYIL